jgi:hypothetical protein
MGMKAFDWRTNTTVISGYGYNQIVLNGWGKGEDVFQFERRTPGVSDEMGVDGEMTASVSADNSVKVVWKFSQLSPMNSILSKMFNRQQAVGMFSGITMGWQDARRADYAATTVGYIENHTPVKRGGKANETEWTLIFAAGGIDLGDPSFAGTPAAISELLGAV